MNTILSRAVLLLFPALFAAGCANFAAIEPGASAQQIETLAGAPANVGEKADGPEGWGNPRGPLRGRTFTGGPGPDRPGAGGPPGLEEEYPPHLAARRD